MEIKTPPIHQLEEIKEQHNQTSGNPAVRTHASTAGGTGFHPWEGNHLQCQSRSHYSTVDNVEQTVLSCKMVQTLENNYQFLKNLKVQAC